MSDEKQRWLGAWSVKVRPGQPKNVLRAMDEGAKTMEVSIAAPPENDKANIELMKFLRKVSGCIPSIIAGHSSKRKRIRLSSE